MPSKIQAFSSRSLKQRLASQLWPLMLLLPIVSSFASSPTLAQSTTGQTLQLRANVTEANAKTGVVVARGNVLITYAVRNLEATATQAIYYSKEGKIVLSGNVIVNQEGNTLKGETITYLVNEGRFTALPRENSQVEATYTVQDTPAEAPAPAPIPINPAPVKPVKMPFPTAPRSEGATIPGPNPEQSAPK